jgi:type I restriction enzyme, S subunit
MASFPIAKLGDVCCFDREQGIHSWLPYVGLEDVESGTGKFLGSKSPASVKSSTFRFSSEHVLYGRLRPYLNKVLLPDFEGHCSTEIFPIRPLPQLTREYLFYWLSMDSTAKAIDATSTGARMPRANMNAILDFGIPVPGLAAQQRIVAILDEAFEGIATAKANAEKNLQNASELFGAHLQVVFSGTKNLVPLSDLASNITDGDHMPPPKAKTGIPFITISNIVKRTRTVDFEDTFLVSPEYFSRLKPNRRPQRGDVLYTVTGATLGIPVLVDSDKDFCFQRHIALIRPNPEINSAWLNYVMSSPQVFAQATAGATGTAQKTVSLTLLRSIKVPLHSQLEQASITARLDELFARIYKLEDFYSARISALDELKKSLLHQAFTGQL